MVELKMSVDLSNARIRTQHTVALTPVLVSADGNREIAFPPIVIDGKNTPQGLLAGTTSRKCRAFPLIIMILHR